MTGNKDRFQQIMDEGHTAAWDQDWQKAANFYQEAFEITPDEPNTLLSLGLAYFELEDYDQSLHYYAKASEISPKDPLPFEKMSQLYELLEQNKMVIRPSLQASELYLSEGNIAKSVECLARVTRVEPENLPAHSRLALIYERTGRNQQSVTEYLIVASLFQHKQDDENAKNAAEHALTILPDSREAAQAISFIGNGQLLPKPVPPRIRQDQIETTSAPLLKTREVVSEEPAELDPVEQAHQTARSVLANLVFDQDDSGRGIDSDSASRTGQVKFSDNIIQQSYGKQVFTHLERALTNLGQGSEEAAADDFERAIEGGLFHPAAYFEIGAIRSKGDQMVSAVSYLNKAVDDAEYGIAGRLLLGRNLRFMGRLNEAATNYLEALRLADSQVVPQDQADDLYNMYAPIIDAEAKQSDPNAKNNLCDSIDELLSRPAWRQNLAQARLDYQIDLEGAPAMPLGEILSNTQGNLIVDSVMTINDYARSGYMRSAMEEAFSALEYAPTYLPLHTYMGELLLKQDHLPEAMAKFGAIAQTYRARGESLHAIRILQRLITAAPMDLAARKQLIELLLDRGQLDEAIQEYIRLANVYYNLADLGKAREVYDDAFKLAQRSSMNRDLSVEILNYIADIELQSLDWKQATQIYKQIQSINPDDSQTTEKLIELYFRFGQEAEAVTELEDYLTFLEISGASQDAFDYLDKLIDENPERIFFRRKLVDLYKAHGREEDAIKELDTIGEVMFNAGDREGAVQVIEEILTLDPPNKVEYQDLIAQMKGEE
jgi:tetratricopeptide (TPR) repeat protein